MRNTARLLLAALLSLIAGQALAQCPTSFPPNTVAGRLAIPAGGGPCQAIPFATLRTQMVPPLPTVSPVEFGAIPNSTAPGVAATNQAAFIAALASSPSLACRPGQAFHTQSITVPANTALIQNCQLFADGTYADSTAVLQVTNNAAALIIDNVLISINTTTYPTINGINLSGTTGTTIKNSSLSGIFPILIGRTRNISILNNRFESGTFGRAIFATSDGSADVTATMTIASPMVVTKASHGLSAGETVIFYTTGALPTGVVAGRVYYVVNVASTTFQVSETSGGAAINSSGSQSGAHSYTSNGPQDLTISGNTIYKSSSVNSQGIILVGASDAIVAKNSILGSTHWGIASNLGARVSITGNIVKYTGAEGIHTDSGVDALIASNDLTFDASSFDVGISVSADNGPPAINTLVTGNMIDSPSGTCIYIVGSTGAAVQSNKLRNCNVGNTALSASIILDGTLTTKNTIGQNTIEDGLGFNAYQVGEANYTSGAPTANYIAQQIGKVGATGYILNVATTDTAIRASTSPASTDTVNGFWFGASAFAKFDVAATNVYLYDHSNTIVSSLGSAGTPVSNWAQTTHKWSSRGYGGVFASLDANGYALYGSTSGTSTIKAPAIAGSGVFTLPASATDTLLSANSTATLTGKTFDTAGSGNSLSINGVAATANTGTGAVARAAAPVFTTPTLGVATATTINGVTIDNAAWTTYTPTVTASVNTITSVSATGFYKQIGKSILFRATATITTNGTAAGRVEVTLPVAVSAGLGAQPLYGQNNSSAAVLSVAITASVSTTKALIFTATGTYPGADSTILVVGGSYEVP